MKISFDFRIFLYQKYGGISRYFVSLFSTIKKEKQIQSNVVCVVHLNKYLKEESRTFLNYVYSRKFKPNNFISFNLAKLINLCWERFYLIFSPPDIYHITYYDRIPFHLRKTKIVVTVYDMIHELFPEEYESKTSDIKKACINEADLVICISENTKKDLIRLLGIDEKKIKVIYLGFANFEEVTNEMSIPDILKGSYILFVGQRSGYKNFTGLVNAYASSLQLKNDFNLVCFGGGAFTQNEKFILKDLNIDNKVFQVAGDDDMLKLCYQNASVFVYPSLYEGFGIPPLEAMSCGTPVCCSNTSSLPEVVGYAAELFNPNSIEEISKAISRVLYTESLSKELIKKGEERIKNFTWERCAKETYQAYKTIL